MNVPKMDIQTDILSNYPKPIREVYLAVLNAEEPVEQHLNLGYLFEIALKYTSVVSIAEYAAGTIRDIRVTETLRKLYGKLPLGRFAEFLRECHRFNLKHKQTILPEDYFQSTKDYPEVTKAYNAIVGYFREKASNKVSISIEDFVNEMVHLRNKTKGHGAITPKLAQGLNGS
jgi:hypothetical protein